MPKTLYGHRIGANIYEPEAPQGVKLVPDNKTLIAMQFNDEPDDDVDPVRLKNMKEIFEHYKPSREIEIKNAEGDGEELVLKFNSMKDFTKDGIIAQSQTMQDLQEKETIYSRMVDILQNNDRLISLLGNEEHKKEFIELLDTLIEELTESES